MKRQLLIFVIALMLIASSTVATMAADWIFQRSYYTHDPVQPVRVGPQPMAVGPYYSSPQGAYYSSGWRQLRSTIQVGSSVDNYYQWDGWTQFGLQH